MIFFEFKIDSKDFKNASGDPICVQKCCDFFCKLRKNELLSSTGLGENKLFLKDFLGIFIFHFKLHFLGL